MKANRVEGEKGNFGVMAAVVGVSLVFGFGLGRVSVSQGDDVPKRAKARGEMAAGDGEKVTFRSSGWRGAGEEKEVSAGDLAAAAALANPRDRDRALQNSLAGATMAEVQKALAWAESLPDGPMKNSALGKILERWGQLDGPGAVAYAAQAYAANGNANLLREALEGWATKDPLAAIKQSEALGLTDGLERDIRQDLLRQWADQGPAGAAEYALANRNPESWGGVVGTVADQWSKQDPKAAANWAAAMGTGRDKKSALYTAISNWADQDLSGAASYVSTQPAGESRDTMAGTLARHIGQEDPAAGLKWAAMVADKGTQERAVAGALIDLYREDEAQARKILQSSQISNEMQLAALARMTNRGPWWR